MEENKQDELARAYTMLSSLRNNITQMGYDVPEKYVYEYHAVLDRLEGIGINVSEFRIPDSEVKPQESTTASMCVEGKKIWGGEKIYSEEKYVDRPFILTKLDAILGYFEIITSEKPRSIGFTKSDES